MFRRLHKGPRARLTDAEAGAFAALPARIVAAGSRPLVYSSGTGAAHLVSPAAADLLLRLEGCRPVGAAGAAIEELRGSGVVVSREVLLRALRETPDPDPPQPITAVTWLTHGRPAALARSITSFAANATSHGRCPKWLVFDDGDEIQAEQTLDVLRPLAAQGRMRLGYFGRSEKERMTATLVEAAHGLVSERLVRFALFGLPGYGTTCGANRNCAVLACCGAPLLVADDDTVCEPAVHPAPVDALSITSERDPSDLFCFDNRKILLEAVARADSDFLAAHQSLLGRTTAGCAVQWPEETIDLASASPALIDLLVAGSGRVTATTAGVYGDGIVGDPHELLWLEGEARERILASEPSFRSAGLTREVLRCPRGPAIGDSNRVFGASLGLDARSLLPPFLPMGRGQDLLFGQTLRVCMPDALVGRPAVAVLHDPVEQRTLPADRTLTPEVEASSLISVLERVARFPPWARSGEERLRSLGAGLEALGRLPAGEFVEAVLPGILRWRSSQLAAAESVLRRHRREPAYWAREVERHIESMQKYMVERPVLPTDAAAGLNPTEALAAFQLQLRLYGELLQAWPEIWRAAQELAEAGPPAGLELR